jgi:hypothetical protein
MNFYPPVLGAFRAGLASGAEPGFPGLRYRCGPACGVAASHPSNPSRVREIADAISRFVESPRKIASAIFRVS